VKPISATRSLVDALRRETLWEGARVLDLCAGSGAVAIAAARRGASATAVDASRRALLGVRLNAVRHGVRVRTVRGDGLDAVGPERFDCIVARESLDARGHLRPNGVLLVPGERIHGKSGVLRSSALPGRALVP
jgi:2-polyprenyl-3-methyl-5-hydroxy-6-metoxy-1,4-benzoquinol methylase